MLTVTRKPLSKKTAFPFYVSLDKWIQFSVKRRKPGLSEKMFKENCFALYQFVIINEIAIHGKLMRYRLLSYQYTYAFWLVECDFAYCKSRHNLCNTTSLDLFETIPYCKRLESLWLVTNLFGNWNKAIAVSGKYLPLAINKISLRARSYSSVNRKSCVCLFTSFFLRRRRIHELCFRNKWRARLDYQTERSREIGVSAEIEGNEEPITFIIKISYYWS